VLLASLKILNIAPCIDDDAVSPIIIPQLLKQRFRKQNVSIDYLHETGHFLMLERPTEWSKFILKVL
jgi:pimeloyl-ACP methyl ester carboxylesterase